MKIYIDLFTFRRMPGTHGIFVSSFHNIPDSTARNLQRRGHWKQTKLIQHAAADRERNSKTGYSAPFNIKTSFVGFILQRPLIRFHFPSCHLSVHDVDSLFPDILPPCEPGGTLKWPVKAISNAAFDNSEAI